MQYTLVVGSLVVFAVCGFFAAWFAPVRLKPLTTAEVAKPLLALAGGEAEVDEVLIAADHRYQTNILVDGDGMWFFTFVTGRDGGLEIIHAQSPDYRRIRSGLSLAEVIPDKPKRAAITADLRANWSLGAAWQKAHGQRYSVHSL